MRSGLWLKIDDHDCHVIATNALRCTRIIADYFVQHFAANLNGRLIIDTIAHVLDCLFIRQAIPNAITSEDEKLILRC